LQFLFIFLFSLCLPLLITVGDGGFVLAADSTANKTLTVKPATVDPLQILFQIGIEEVEKGNYVSAIGIFESLVKKSQSPRVQLELARALFLDRRYRSSREVFEDVLRQPDIPWSVKENVLLYLDAIDAALGFIKFGVSLVSDSNPRNFTDSRQVVIGGQPLKIVPPDDNDTIYGIRYSVSAAKAITESASLSGYLDAYYSDFSGGHFDRWGTDGGLFIAPLALPNFKFKAGLEESFYDKEHLYEFPYVGLVYIPKPLYQFNLNSEFKLGKLRVPNADYLDASNLSLTTNIARRASSKIYTSGYVYLEKSTTKEDPYSYYGGALGINLSFDLIYDWRLKPFASAGKRLYEGEDPFWGETRKDTRFMVGVTLKKINWQIFGYAPELGVSYEETNSNIDYYSYSKVGVIVKFDEILSL
jgi:hypothetical protein